MKNAGNRIKSAPSAAFTSGRCCNNDSYRLAFRKELTCHEFMRLRQEADEEQINALRQAMEHETRKPFSGGRQYGPLRLKPCRQFYLEPHVHQYRQPVDLRARRLEQGGCGRSGTNPGRGKESTLPPALVAERELVSHRPRPLFRRELSQLRGCMYHVGNPRCASPDYEGLFFAYEVLSPASSYPLRRRFFEIAPEYRHGFQRLVHMLLEASPRRSVFFYTDWQFGPARATRGGVISELEFWHQHDDHLLRLNACYTIQLNV
jgi:hypothetical protein